MIFVLCGDDTASRRSSPLVLSTMSSAQDEKIEGVHHCTFANCDFYSCRKDRVKRHIQDVHERKRAICECGAEITQSVLSRHRNESCPARGKNKIKNKKSKASNKPANVTNQPINDVQTGKIEINYRMEQSDGALVITHDDIIINGIKLSLVPHELTKIENYEGKF